MKIWCWYNWWHTGIALVVKAQIVWFWLQLKDLFPHNWGFKCLRIDIVLHNKYISFHVWLMFSIWIFEQIFEKLQLNFEEEKNKKKLFSGVWYVGWNDKLSCRTNTKLWKYEILLKEMGKICIAIWLRNMKKKKIGWEFETNMVKKCVSNLHCKGLKWKKNMTKYVRNLHPHYNGLHNKYDWEYEINMREICEKSTSALQWVALQCTLHNRVHNDFF